MATALTTTIASAANACKLPVVNQLFKRGAVGKALWANRIVEPGETIQIPVVMSKPGLVGEMDEGDEFTYTTSELLKTPALDWREYWATGFVTRRKMKQASGRAQVVDLVKLQIDSASRELQERLWTHVFTGDGATSTPPKIEGLGVICNATNTYAGLLRTTTAYVNWKGNAVDTEASVEDADLINALDTIMPVGGDVNDMVIYTTPKIKMWMVQKWGVPYQRFEGWSKANFGFGAYSFFDVPILADPLIADDNIWILNMKFLHWVVPDSNDPFQVETFMDESDLKGIKIRIAPMLQFACSWPKYQYHYSSCTSIVKTA